jgi:hypothetical protein
LGGRLGGCSHGQQSCGDKGVSDHGDKSAMERRPAKGGYLA